MKPNERLQATTHALAELDPTQLLDADEVATLASDTEADPHKLIPVMIYVKARLVEKLGRVACFKRAYPLRSVAQVEDLDSHYGVSTAKGELLHTSTLDVKARRVEASALYKKVYTLLQTSLYVSFATDRLLVLEEALRKSLDINVSDRDKPQYMKIFLDETRKPESAAKMELNLNLTQNNVSVIDVESRMNDIAKQLAGGNAGDIIEVLHSDHTKD